MDDTKYRIMLKHMLEVNQIRHYVSVDETAIYREFLEKHGEKISPEFKAEIQAKIENDLKSK